MASLSVAKVHKQAEKVQMIAALPANRRAVLHRFQEAANESASAAWEREWEAQILAEIR